MLGLGLVLVLVFRSGVWVWIWFWSLIAHALALGRHSRVGIPALSVNAGIQLCFPWRCLNSFPPLSLPAPCHRVLNVDPPVISVQGFLTHDECDAITKAAEGEQWQSCRLNVAAAEHGNALPRSLDSCCR